MKSHTSLAAIGVTILATGCGDQVSSPADGLPVATVTLEGTTLAMSLDGEDTYVILIDNRDVPHIAVDWVHGSEVTPMPIAVTDWLDYLGNLFIRVNPTTTALVSGGIAYFIGAYGVTVVPLDGSASQTFYQPNPESPIGHVYNSLGSFTVDGGQIYVSDADISTNSNNFGRFDANGAWELLFMGPAPLLKESCLGGGMVADADAVYWTTSLAIRAYNKHDGTVTTVVDLAGRSSLAPSLVTIGGDSIVWFDWFDAAIHVANKAGTTPAAALGPTGRLDFGPAAPPPFSMFATADRVEWLTGEQLQRLPLAGGQPEVLVATRPAQGGFYLGLAPDGHNVYFTYDAMGSDGGPGEVTVRSFPE
jgi:hypothetical protein